jgi:hypothetical protein
MNLHLLRYALPAVVWTILITILCLMPGKDLPSVSIVNFDKFVHISFFGALNALYLRWAIFGNGLKISPLKITLFTIFYGGMIEILQGTFYTDRHADVMDFISNSVGALIALYCIRFTPNFLK